jgi:crotonobetainyl-CoA:carnitine CoA-transferase CaiB-like acyl-CoA transferase
VTNGPLHGLRAVEIGDRGEVAGKLLADAGVAVVKVEPPQGAASRHTGPFVDDKPDPNGSLHFAAVNTSKRGVTLDLSRPEDTSRWRALVQASDIVIDSARLDAPELGHEAFASHQRLVWCSITPFGLNGPRRDWVVTDLVSMALGGPPMSTGYDDHDIPPVRPDGGHSLAMAGEYAVVGIITAILQRARTGRGQLVDVSIHEAVSSTTEGAFPNWEYFGRLVQRQTGRHAAAIPTPPWQYRCADGEYILLMNGGIPRSLEIFRRLLAWMDETGAAENLHDPKFEQALFSDPAVANPDRMHIATVIGRFVQTLPAEEVYRRGQSLHMPWGRVRNPEDNLSDPHWQDRGFFLDQPVPGTDRTAAYPGAPYRFTKSRVAISRRAPMLGEHNVEVFQALGFGN